MSQKQNIKTKKQKKKQKKKTMPNFLFIFLPKRLNPEVNISRTLSNRIAKLSFYKETIISITFKFACCIF